MNILDFPATIQLGNMWRRQSTTEMLKQKGNFKCSGARFSKVPVTFRARSYILKSKSIELWRSF